MAEPELWVDPAFPPDHTSIGCAKDSKLMTPPYWSPIQAVFPDKPLLGEIDPNDLQQGGIGDCWLISAFQTLAEYPDAVKQLFKTQEHPPDGKYVLRLYSMEEEEWKDVEVDCRIPCRDGKAAYVKPGGNGVWMCLLEKACAKLLGSYMKLNANIHAVGWTMLCGPGDFNEIDKRNPERIWKETSYKPKELRIEGIVEDPLKSMFKSRVKIFAETSDNKDKTPVEKEKLFSQILEWDRKNFVMGCMSWPEGLTDPDAAATSEILHPNGLVSCHGFGVLAAYEGHGFKLLQLRNPWGNHTEWKGAWCDDSEEWQKNPEVAKEVNFKPRSDGIFWMSFDDWEQNFDGFQVFKVEQPGKRAALMIQPVENVRQEKERQLKEERAKVIQEEMYSNGGWYVGKGMDFVKMKELEEVRIWESEVLYQEVVKMCMASWKCDEIQAKLNIDNPRHNLPQDVRSYLRARWQQKIAEEKAEAEAAEAEPEPAAEPAAAPAAAPAAWAAWPPPEKGTPVFMGVKKARKLDEKNVMYEGMILSMEDFKKYLASEIIEAATEPTEPEGEVVVNSVRGKLSLREKPEASKAAEA